VVAVIAMVAFMAALNIQIGCTPLNQLLDNCASPTPWYVIAGIATVVDLGLFMSLVSDW